MPELPAGTRWWRPGDEVAMLEAAVACLERGEFEGENDGALRLYESEGFERDVEWPHWVRNLER